MKFYDIMDRLLWLDLKAALSRCRNLCVLEEVEQAGLALHPGVKRALEDTIAITKALRQRTIG